MVQRKKKQYDLHANTDIAKFYGATSIKLELLTFVACIYEMYGLRMRNKK